MFSNRVSRGSLTQLCACVLFSSGPAATLATEPAPRVDRGTPRVEVASIVDGELAAAIERAAQGARRRLARPGCQRVLDEFRVASQASLREVAASVVASPEGALARAIFRDGATPRPAAAALRRSPGQAAASCSSVASASRGSAALRPSSS